MPIRHAQRRHIVHSLESLLYQLHTLSFLLSPSIWTFLSRVLSQFQFARPRDIDPSRSLRFWFTLVVLINIIGVWAHTTEGPAKGRSIILDFVGMAHAPSKVQLLLLDFVIIVLQMVLVTIAYETSLAAAMPQDAPDSLLSIPPSPTLTPSDGLPKTPDLSTTESPYVLDLRPSLIINRLRHPPPPPSSDQDASRDLLPMPNTTSLNNIRMLVRARTQLQERTRTLQERTRALQMLEESTRTLQELQERTRALQERLEAESNPRRTRDETEEEAEDRQRRVPGAMDDEDGS